MLSEELGRPIRYEETPPPPLPSYEALWKFLSAGGFDHVSTRVPARTLANPIARRAYSGTRFSTLCPHTKGYLRVLGGGRA